MVEQERIFVAEELAYRLQVMHMVLLSFSVCWSTNANTLRLAEGMASVGSNPKENRLDLGVPWNLS